MHGYRRKPRQVLPASGVYVTCVQINDDRLADLEWCLRSLTGVGHDPKTIKRKEWDYVLVAPIKSVRDFWCSNDGMQAWRNKISGYVVPDHCRQTGGCPEIWNTEDVKRKRELRIVNLAEIEEYVVLRHPVQYKLWPEV